MSDTSQTAAVHRSQSSTIRSLPPEQILGQSAKLSHGCVLKNRLAKSAMSEELAGPDGAPNALLDRKSVV